MYQPIFRILYILIDFIDKHLFLHKSFTNEFFILLFDFTVYLLIVNSFVLSPTCSYLIISSTNLFIEVLEYN